MLHASMTLHTAASAATKPAKAKVERLSASASLHAVRGVHATVSYNSSTLQVSIL
jgi:hypothetical protein